MPISILKTTQQHRESARFVASSSEGWSVALMTSCQHGFDRQGSPSLVKGAGFRSQYILFRRFKSCPLHYKSKGFEPDLNWTFNNNTTVQVEGSDTAPCITNQKDLNQTSRNPFFRFWRRVRTYHGPGGSPLHGLRKSKSNQYRKESLGTIEYPMPNNFILKGMLPNAKNRNNCL